MKKIFASILVAVILLSRCSKKNESVSQQDFMMDTAISLSVYGETEYDFSSVFSPLRDVERTYSAYIDSSVVSKINSGEKIPLTDEQSVFLKRVKALCENDEYFDITIGPLTKLWKSYGEKNKVPSRDEISLAADKVGVENLVIEKNIAYLSEPGMSIDLGGVAKGLACQKGYDILKSQGKNAILSVGGSLAIVGNKNGKPFNIGLRDPYSGQDEYFGTVELENTFVATSGVYERFFESDGKIYHHILNPQTGYPHSGDFVSLSVIGNDGTMCDYLSTSLFFESEKTLISAADKYKVDVIGVTKDGRVIASKAIREKINITNDKYTLE